MSEKIPEIFYVEVYITHREDFKKILDELHPENVSRKAELKNEEWVAYAHIEQSKIEWLKKQGYKFKVIENATAKGLERQKQVGKGNRYEKSNIIPKGLGKKIK